MLRRCNKRGGGGALGGAGSSGRTGRGAAGGVGKLNTAADVGRSTGGGGGCCGVAVPCVDVILGADCGASRVCSLLVVVAAGTGATVWLARCCAKRIG